MTREELANEVRHMVAGARGRFRGDVEQLVAEIRSLADSIDPAIGEVSPSEAWAALGRRVVEHFQAEPAPAPADGVNAHTLTLLFHRFLSEREWREVAEIVRTVPYVVELRMDAVSESPEQLFTDGWNPQAAQHPPKVGDPMHPTCMDCGLPYERFPLDMLLPRSQWMEIHPDDGGLLCAQCIVTRASKLPGALSVQAVIEIAVQPTPKETT